MIWIGFLLFILTSLVAVIGVSMAWYQWFNARPTPSVPGWRRILGLVSVLVCSLQVLFFFLSKPPLLSRVALITEKGISHFWGRSKYGSSLW
jgi:hypothetical protein